MITKKGINFVKLCRNRFNFSSGLSNPNCCTSQNSVCTSAVTLCKKTTSPNTLKIQQEFLKSEKEKYEDTFGSLENFQLKYQLTEEDSEDIKEIERDRAAQGKNIRQYIKEIQTHLRNHDYKKALHVLEVDMVNDRKPAVSHIYDMMVSYNGRLGNLKEAYRLYIAFKRRNGFVNGGMYTSMFNACANCSNSTYALEKADAIREHLNISKGAKANLTNYNVMLKAYGRHGDLPTVFKIFDEVLEKRDKIKPHTYSFMFQACISDKNAGLRHALLLWRKMLQARIKPDIFHFNLLLRCVKECSFGEIQLMEDLIKQIQAESGVFYKRKVEFKNINNETKRTVLKIPVSGKEFISDASDQTDTVKQSLKSEKECNKNCDPGVALNENESPAEADNLVSEESREMVEKTCDDQVIPMAIYPLDEPKLPNLLDLNPTIGDVISFGDMKLPHHRFLCLGGLKGFLEVMSRFKVKPNVKTFTMLLHVIPSATKSEEELINQAHALGVKLDTGFFNNLILRRNFRDEKEEVIQDALNLMQKEELAPDILTFGVLAVGCRTRESAKKLVASAREHRIRLNTEILGALLNKAEFARDMLYVKDILRWAKEDETKLDSKFIALVKKIVEKEQYASKKLKDKKENTESEKMISY